MLFKAAVYRQTTVFLVFFLFVTILMGVTEPSAYASSNPTALPVGQVCVLKNSDITNIAQNSDYVSNPAAYAAKCGNAATVNVPNPGYDYWLDIAVRSQPRCVAGLDARIDYWIIARDLTTNAITPVRFKSVQPAETSKSHIDLGKYAWNGHSLQFAVVTESAPNTASCTNIAVLSADVAQRTEMIPTADRTNAAIKHTFNVNLPDRPGFSNAWNWNDWRRAPVMAKLMSDLHVPFFRTFMQVPISNEYGCNSNDRAQHFDYRYCYTGDTLIDQTDNTVEELFYHGIPIIANVHGAMFSNIGVQQMTDNYYEPANFMNMFAFPNSNIWDWSQDRFVDLASIGSQPVQAFLNNAYQYYRYDFLNPDFMYGVTQALLTRYDAALVAVEPGDEQNWHPPGIRSANPNERAAIIAASVQFFSNFCDFAHAHSKYCIMTSMADSITWHNDPSGALPAMTMLENYAEVSAKADFANFHLYFTHNNGNNFANYSPFFGYIIYHLAAYATSPDGNLSGGKKVIITEFGYDSPSDASNPSQDQLIAQMRAFMNKNAKYIAGSGYWMDIGNAWQANPSGTPADAYLLSAPMVPIDVKEGNCPSNGYCPFVPTCSFSTNTCPDYSATGNAWAFGRNDNFYNQFEN